MDSWADVRAWRLEVLHERGECERGCPHCEDEGCALCGGPVEPDMADREICRSCWQLEVAD